MSFPRLHPVGSVKLLAAGVLLAAGAAGCGLSDAKAASDVTAWTAVTKAETAFRCISQCQAGGPGPVADTALVIPVRSPDQPGPGDPPKIDAHERTVAIQCKVEFHTIYQVEVRDTNWAGRWYINKEDLGQPIDDSGFPLCPA